MNTYLVRLPRAGCAFYTTIQGTSEQDVFDRVRASGSFAVEIMKVAGDPADGYSI